MAIYKSVDDAVNGALLDIDRMNKLSSKTKFIPNIPLIIYRIKARKQYHKMMLSFYYMGDDEPIIRFGE